MIKSSSGLILWPLRVGQLYQWALGDRAGHSSWPLALDAAFKGYCFPHGYGRRPRGWPYTYDHRQDFGAVLARNADAFLTRARAEGLSAQYHGQIALMDDGALEACLTWAITHTRQGRPPALICRQHPLHPLTITLRQEQDKRPKPKLNVSGRVTCAPAYKTRSFGKLVPILR